MNCVQYHCSHDGCRAVARTADSLIGGSMRDVCAYGLISLIMCVLTDMRVRWATLSAHRNYNYVFVGLAPDELDHGHEDLVQANV